MNTAKPERGQIALRIFLAVSGLISAAAAMMVGHQSGHPDVACIVIICSLALLAGHAWVIPLLAAAELILVGILWPLAVYQSPPDSAAQLAIYSGLLSAIPSLAIFPKTLPHLLALLTGVDPETPWAYRSAQAIGVSSGLLWLCLPLFS